MKNQPRMAAAHPPGQRRRKFITRLGKVMAGLVILSLLGVVFESLSEASDARAYPPPGQMVDVGGYRMHIYCTGSGSPTVVIDAGLGSWSTGWGTVQAEVAQTTRVCTYDRAGIGWSETGPLPRNADQFAKELYALLHAANIPGPYVLVGHSLGGLPVRVFTDSHPAEVAGVVLIDSMIPGQTRFASARMLSPLPVLARFGVLRFLAKVLGVVNRTSPEDKADNAVLVSPKFMQALTEEARGIPASLAQAGAVGSIGDLPLIVLSRGLDPDPEWQAGQSKLLQWSTNSQQMIAEKSGHNIELDQPEIAVQAIVKMVQIVRRQ